MDEEHIHFKRVRPRIRLESELSSEEITNRIREKLKSDDCYCNGQVTANFATIYPPSEDQHYWSPQLTITLEESENSTLVRGLYGPHPQVWTMFVFFYSIIGFVTLIVSMVGLSYWSLDQPAGILWVVPGLFLLFLSLFLVAYFGQRFGHKQLTSIHRFLEDCLNQKIDTI